MISHNLSLHQICSFLLEAAPEWSTKCNVIGTSSKLAPSFRNILLPRKAWDSWGSPSTQYIFFLAQGLADPEISTYVEMSVTENT